MFAISSITTNQRVVDHHGVAMPQSQLLSWLWHEQLRRHLLPCATINALRNFSTRSPPFIHASSSFIFLMFLSSLAVQHCNLSGAWSSNSQVGSLLLPKAFVVPVSPSSPPFSSFSLFPASSWCTPLDPFHILAYVFSHLLLFRTWFCHKWLSFFNFSA